MILRTLVLALCVSLLASCSSETPEPTVRHFTHKSVVGVSMGGGAAAQIGLSQPERWDFVGIIGAPLVDLRAFARMIHRGWMGGFCSLEYLEQLHAQGVDLNSEQAYCGLYTERSLPGQMAEHMAVPSDWMQDGRAPMWEYTSDYNNWWRGHSGGRGANYGRSSLVGSITDILKAYGSPLYEPNPDIPWAAPGVTHEWLALSNEEKCANPIVQEGYYHAEYNPEGTYPVITYCDGNYGDDPTDSFENQLARMRPDSARNIPQAIMLAVDINRNGQRDYGEPIVSNSSERYDDFGPDGLPNDLEPGYDPQTNPDPSGDDYNSFTNPTGTENNYWHDQGEPYVDYGLDGVPGTGDHGEGTGRFERSPGWNHAEAFDPHTLLENIDPSELARLTIYMDAGIRDFLNTTIHSNRFFGQLESMVGKDNARAFNNFTSLAGSNGVFDRFEPNYDIIPQYSYVRYGDPNASDYEIAQGDGNHVGTIEQAIDRAMNALSVAQSVWPHTDHTLADNPFGDIRYADVDTYESQTLGRTQEYSYILPPGYHDPENAERRYPVVFFLHGQGQRHTDQLGYSLMTQSAMVESARPNVAKWGKFIIIYPNGRCPSGVCGSGNFWTNFVSGNESQRFYDDFFELVDLVDTRFRTLEPEDRPLDESAQ